MRPVACLALLGMAVGTGSSDVHRDAVLVLAPDVPTAQLMETLFFKLPSATFVTSPCRGLTEKSPVACQALIRSLLHCDVASVNRAVPLSASSKKTSHLRHSSTPGRRLNNTSSTNSSEVEDDDRERVSPSSLPEERDGRGEVQPAAPPPEEPQESEEDQLELVLEEEDEEEEEEEKQERNQKAVPEEPHPGAGVPVPEALESSATGASSDPWSDAMGLRHHRRRRRRGRRLGSKSASWSPPSEDVTETRHMLALFTRRCREKDERRIIRFVQLIGVMNVPVDKLLLGTDTAAKPRLLVVTRHPLSLGVGVILAAHQGLDPVSSTRSAGAMARSARSHLEGVCDFNSGGSGQSVDWSQGWSPAWTTAVGQCALSFCSKLRLLHDVQESALRCTLRDSTDPKSSGVWGACAGAGGGGGAWGWSSSSRARQRTRRLQGEGEGELDVQEGDEHVIGSMASMMGNMTYSWQEDPDDEENAFGSTRHTRRELSTASDAALWKQRRRRQKWRGQGAAALAASSASSSSTVGSTSGSTIAKRTGVAPALTEPVALPWEGYRILRAEDAAEEWADTARQLSAWLKADVAPDPSDLDRAAKVRSRYFASYMVRASGSKESTGDTGEGDAAAPAQRLQRMKLTPKESVWTSSCQPVLTAFGYVAHPLKKHFGRLTGEKEDAAQVWRLGWSSQRPSPSFTGLDKFYMHTGPAMEWRHLIPCYLAENHGETPWADERWVELAQNTGSLWLHEALLKHPLRTLDPSEASLIIVPVETFISSRLHFPCEGQTHQERMQAVAKVVMESQAFARHRGADHLVICPWWGAAASWGRKEIHGVRVAPEAGSIWDLLHERAVLATFDEHFGQEWHRLLVLPYVAHALLTTSSSFLGLPLSLRPSPNEAASLGSLPKAWDPVLYAPLVKAKLESATKTPEKGSKGDMSVATAKAIRRTAERTSERLEILRAQQIKERPMSFYFRGAVLHGIDCPKNMTWVRKAAFEAMQQVDKASFIPTEGGDVVFKGKIFAHAATVRNRQKRDNYQMFSAPKYAAELRHSRYCIHFRGDTTTSRRVFDAVAAGCVPVLVSDGVHLPFHTTLDYNSFTVTLAESTFLQGPDHAAQALNELADDVEGLARRQLALRRIQRDLLYGRGQPVPSFVVRALANQTVSTSAPPTGSTSSMPSARQQANHSNSGAAVGRRLSSFSSASQSMDHGDESKGLDPSFHSRLVDHLLFRAFELARFNVSTAHDRTFPLTFRDCQKSLKGSRTRASKWFRDEKGKWKKDER